MKKNVTDLWCRFARSGDMTAFKAVYHECDELVFFSAYKFLKDEEMAKDVAQTVWLRLIENRMKYTHVTNFYGWLQTIVYNECKKKVRHPSVKQTDSLPEGELYRPELTTSPDIDSTITRDDLSELVDILPQKNYSDVLSLEYQGLTNGEIAYELGVSEKYVRDRKSDAKKELFRLGRRLGW